MGKQYDSATKHGFFRLMARRPLIFRGLRVLSLFGLAPKMRPSLHSQAKRERAFGT